jgi:hypothetical protein
VSYSYSELNITGQITFAHDDDTKIGLQGRRSRGYMIPECGLAIGFVEVPFQRRFSIDGLAFGELGYKLIQT